ncbi:hypothetical protein RFI_16739 [Reticulomyxa filosa]|uniref:Uncharacterized protein n=1 Tax=Reticulomyxa filosa TaxID=46433 RepID=X6N411_RETFI|nr:hypothetical protein RFI_16739 [Reticulomyxa filosa]|eukprot:ETO20479.1 hypothetical protein RFI_16739 [Reticulomyxa filosa]
MYIYLFTQQQQSIIFMVVVNIEQLDPTLKKSALQMRLTPPLSWDKEQIWSHLHSKPFGLKHYYNHLKTDVPAETADNAKTSEPSDHSSEHKAEPKMLPSPDMTSHEQTAINGVEPPTLVTPNGNEHSPIQQSGNDEDNENDNAWLHSPKQSDLKVPSPTSIVSEELWGQLAADIRDEQQKAKKKKEAGKNGLFSSFFRSFRQKPESTHNEHSPALVHRTSTSHSHGGPNDPTKGIRPPPLQPPPKVPKAQTKAKPKASNDKAESNVIVKGTVQLPPLRDCVQHVGLYQTSNVLCYLTFVRYK